MSKSSAYVVWFRDVDKEDVELVGGKGANLGEMTKAGFPVPNGFIVTSKAYYDFLKENNLGKNIKNLLNLTDLKDQASLEKTSKLIKRQIIRGEMSEDLIKEVFSYYKQLGGVFSDALVAVRSSATAEDLANASFAGQQKTFLNVKGEASLIVKIKEAWASLFEPRAIFYRHEQKFDHFRIGIAIPVQKMIAAEKSGIMFTIDPVTNDKFKIVIEAIYGLGELIVQGEVTPDHYEVFKKDLSIFKKNVSKQRIMMKKSGTKNKIINIGKNTGGEQKISDEQITKLAELGKKLEEHYYFPQDIEWAIEKNHIYIVQTRPVTTIKLQTKSEKQQGERGEVILQGAPASPGVASGHVKIIKSPKEINKIAKGEVMVAEQTSPDFVPAMKKAIAIITDKGGRTSHAAIVSRELGIPAVVGTEKATKILKDGLVVSVDGAKGEIYKGGLLKSSFNGKSNSFSYHTATKVYVNLSEPDLAEQVAKKNADGVGLLRAEFMLAQIGVHPKKLIKDGKSHLFVEKLADGLEKFCKSFNPRPVVYRTSDLKTNEYKNLIGGSAYEPEEPNPMLGFRGAFRYINDPDVFNLELQAIKQIREKMDYKNLWIMIPFVRTVKELIEVKKLISNAGLHRSSHFKIWMMVEIPSNVILLEEFIKVGIDGISIGSNDLTMLLLGTDRDNSEVAREFDEQNEAVIWALEKVIKTAHQNKITSSLCGQAASMYPRLLEKLVKFGVTSVSVSPDAIDDTKRLISEYEEKLLK